VVFSELITKLKAEDRIIFHSEQDGPLSDLRKLQPMWLYGTSRAQVVQTLFLSTIGLEGNAPLKGDVLITRYRADESNQGAALFTEKLFAEAKRRSMKVLVGPVSKSEADELIQLGVDGIITNQP
jgi:glycerophosphoryl diester phosphodiesterase